jgi:hypothetical protein
VTFLVAAHTEHFKIVGQVVLFVVVAVMHVQLRLVVSETATALLTYPVNALASAPRDFRPVICVSAINLRLKIAKRIQLSKFWVGGCFVIEETSAGSRPRMPIVIDPHLALPFLRNEKIVISLSR